MPRFRKRPVVIDAERFTGTEGSAAEVTGALAPPAGLPGQETGVIGWRALPEDRWGPGMGVLVIRTLEGDMEASPGDWIIRGVRGELYPCKAGIFQLSYERIL